MHDGFSVCTAAVHVCAASVGSHHSPCIIREFACQASEVHLSYDFYTAYPLPRPPTGSWNAPPFMQCRPGIQQGCASRLCKGNSIPGSSSRSRLCQFCKSGYECIYKPQYCMPQANSMHVTQARRCGSPQHGCLPALLVLRSLLVYPAQMQTGSLCLSQSADHAHGTDACNKSVPCARLLHSLPLHTDATS